LFEDIRKLVKVSIPTDTIEGFDPIEQPAKTPPKSGKSGPRNPRPSGKNNSRRRSGRNASRAA
jgi:hypothetical protein